MTRVQCLSCGLQWDYASVFIHICPNAAMLSSATLEDRVKLLEARVIILEHQLASKTLSRPEEDKR